MVQQLQDEGICREDSVEISLVFYNPETFMSSAASASVQATPKCSQKAPRAKSGAFRFLGWIPMIQIPFNSSCVALQHETGMKFFHRAVREVHGIENNKFLVQPRGIFHIFLKVSAQEQVINDKK